MTDLVTYGEANIQLNYPFNLSGCARPKLCTEKSIVEMQIVKKSKALFFFISSHWFLLVELYSYLCCKR